LCEVFRVARALQERQNITQRRQEVRATFHELTPKNVETIQWLVHEDHRRTIKDIAAIVNVSYGRVQNNSHV
jgi:predicted transcriptional regulator